MPGLGWARRARNTLEGLYRVVRRPIDSGRRARFQRCGQLPNSVWGGQYSQSCVSKTATLMPRAARVLKMGQVPKKAAMPRIETIAEATASCRHTSPGTRMPKNEKAAPTKPRRDRSQKALAIAVAVVLGRVGRSQ